VEAGLLVFLQLLQIVRTKGLTRKLGEKESALGWKALPSRDKTGCKVCYEGALALVWFAIHFSVKG
jgi:hypothetical protein